VVAGNDIEEMVQVHKMKRRLVVGLALIAAFAFSGLAFAATDGDEDAVINLGYDGDDGNHFFMWNVTFLEYEPDTEGLEETLEGYDQEKFAALVEACGLEGDDPENPVEYTYTYDPSTGEITVELDDEGDEGSEAEESELEDPEAEEIVCGDWMGGDVTGPAGQVNHGMFLRFFNHNYEGEYKGCITSHIARSGLGKGDDQVKAGDTETEGEEGEAPAEETVEPVEGTITFETVLADCQKGPKGPKGEAEDGDDEGQRRGPPQHVLDKHADKWGEGGPGKSGKNQP
jgi:hypothetical protein